MCLLDGVLEWDAQHIVCRASSHRDPANPLRVADTRPAACGIEYGAQAMAVHGALLAADGAPLGPGVLASVAAWRCWRRGSTTSPACCASPPSD
jgi:predicted hotdog family 3-hydroxylacyl-ACP dehydratase